MLVILKAVINRNFLQSALITFAVKRSLFLPPSLNLVPSGSCSYTLFPQINCDGCVEISASFTQPFHVEVSVNTFSSNHPPFRALCADLKLFSFLITEDSSVPLVVPCNRICLHSIFFLGKEINSDKVMTST